MTENQFTELPENFTALKHEHQLVKRTHGLKQDVALYRRTNITHDNPNPHFEVILIGTQEAGERTIGDQTITYEAGELYPSVSQWGTNGFTFMTLPNAEVKFEELAKRGSGKMPE
jgi:hypothetical protein